MAARKVPLHRAWTPDKVRQRIRTSLIVNRLTDHVLSGTEMAQTQITAALGLLRKTLPDLTAVAHSGSLELRKPNELTDAELAHIAAGGSAGAIESPGSQPGPTEVH